jgi:putative MATE family efflux protein
VICLKENKIFIKNLTLLTVPIIIQNLLFTTVGTADTFMLNFVGQAQLSAVALANQLQFVLSLFFMGLTAGTGIMMAQYLGKEDTYAVNYIFRLALKASVIVSLCFSLLAIITPYAILRVFTNDNELIQIGSEYLRIVGISYLFSGFSQIYLVTLKTMQKAKKSAAISTTTLVINVGLNAVFIFGLLGAPKLGVMGVAVATVIARLIEVILCGFDFISTKIIILLTNNISTIKQDFFKVTYPITLQGFVWGGAMAALAAIMGRMGSDSVAANSVASVIQQIATVASFGFAEGGAILLGNDLGRKDFAAAKSNSAVLIKISVLCGIIGCVLMLLLESTITNALSLTPAALKYFGVMYKLASVNVIFAAVTYTMLCGIFTAGGDTKFGLYLDGAVMWGFCVLLGSVAAFALKLNPIWVFVVINLDELVKTPVVIKRYFKNKWINNIT